MQIQELNYLLTGYFHTDVWDFYSSDQEVLDNFVAEESPVVIEDLKLEILNILSSTNLDGCLISVNSIKNTVKNFANSSDLMIFCEGLVGSLETAGLAA